MIRFSTPCSYSKFRHHFIKKEPVSFSDLNHATAIAHDLQVLLPGGSVFAPASKELRLSAGISLASGKDEL